MAPNVLSEDDDPRWFKYDSNTTVERDNDNVKKGDTVVPGRVWTAIATLIVREETADQELIALTHVMLADEFGFEPEASENVDAEQIVEDMTLDGDFCETTLRLIGKQVGNETALENIADGFRSSDRTAV